MTIKFHFKNIDESIEFVQQSKSMLIGFNHKFDIEDDGKTVVIKVETIKKEHIKISALYRDWETNSIDSSKIGRAHV